MNIRNLLKPLIVISVITSGVLMLSVSQKSATKLSSQEVIANEVTSSGTVPAYSGMWIGMPSLGKNAPFLTLDQIQALQLNSPYH